MPAEELTRRHGVKPITRVEDMVRPGSFESDEELDEFLSDLGLQRVRRSRSRSALIQ